MAQNVGHIVQIIGPVLDIKFSAEQMPAIYNAIEIKKQDDSVLVAEVAQHLGDDIVRCIAMSATEGLVRGMEATDTGAPISVPVGTQTLGRIFNVTGKAVDGKPDPQVTKWPIHRKAPSFEEQSTSAEILETRIKVVDPI